MSGTEECNPRDHKFTYGPLTPEERKYSFNQRAVVCSKCPFRMVISNAPLAPKEREWVDSVIKRIGVIA